MPRILVAGPIHDTGRAMLERAPGVAATYITELSEPSIAARIAEADALILRTQPLTGPTIARAPGLRIVSRHGVGYDAVDVAALSARGIPLAVCGDVNSTSVAEHAAMLILAASKRVLRADSAVRSGPWNWRNRLEAQDVAGRTLLQVGFGRIGQHIARMMRGFGLKIIAHDPHLERLGWPEGDVRPVKDLHAGLAMADIVSLSVPRGDRPLIGAAELHAAKSGVVIVNTARGGIIDEAALLSAVESGKVGAAGLDVFDAEPLPAGHPLTRHDQIILSPHIAGVTEGAAERMAVGAVQNVLDFFAGRLDPDLIINREHLHNVQA